jgi:NAD(P)-dependent dehydrogenase (short-subunit alcohol dehydrogenase family)
MSTPFSEVALVTGASSGIGRAAAVLLARSGYRVFATVRSPEDEASLREATAGLPLDVLRLDVADESATARCVQEIVGQAHRIDVLINNAGFAQLGAVEDLTREALRRQFEVNVFGPMHLCREVLPIMRSRGSGRIVNVSSLAGRVSVPFIGAYCASKFALEAFSDSLRVEARSAGVRVSLVEPGPVRTRFQEALRSSASDLPSDSVFRAHYEELLAEPTSKFAVESERVARVILKAIRSPWPRARYRVRILEGVVARITRVVPASAMDWGIARFYGLSPAAPHRR